MEQQMRVAFGETGEQRGARKSDRGAAGGQLHFVVRTYRFDPVAANEHGPAFMRLILGRGPYAVGKQQDRFCIAVGSRPSAASALREGHRWNEQQRTDKMGRAFHVVWP